MTEEKTTVETEKKVETETTERPAWMPVSTEKVTTETKTTETPDEKPELKEGRLA